MATCPRCAVPLVETGTPLGYVYVCPQCGGQRAAMAILRRAGASPAFLKHLWGAALGADATRRLACPECRRPMAAVPTFLETHRLDLDVCPSCQSVWLDRAEFDAIPKAPRGPAARASAAASHAAPAAPPSAAEEEDWPAEVRRTDAAAPAPEADPSRPPASPAARELPPMARLEAAIRLLETRAGDRPHQAPAPPAARELSPRARQQAAVTQVQARAATDSEAVAGSRSPEHAWHWVPGLLGMPVEAAEPVRRERPWTTWSIAAFLVAVFLVTLPDRVQVIREWGFVPAEWARHGGMTLLVSFFLHAGLFHLISNVYFFVVFGDNVEDHLGPVLFVLLIGVAHVVGLALHGLYEPHAEMPCVGASAGISGILGYYAVVFPRARLAMLWFFLFWIRMPAIVALVAFLVLQVMGSALQASGVGGVSYLAHLGGLVVGIAAGAAARWTKGPEDAAAVEV